MADEQAQRWQFWIDRGGTFTDCIGIEPSSGEMRIKKVLSSDEAPLIGIRTLMSLADEAPIPPCDIRMGTTVATNALLERKGARCALMITRGFAELLEIGTQARPKIFELNITKPQTLYTEVLEVNARVGADGSVLEQPDAPLVTKQLQQLLNRGIRSLAIVVLHSYKNPELELSLGELARQVGFEHVCLSHVAANKLGLLRRGDTAVLDAYLTPLLLEYLERLERELPGSSLLLMQSGGQLASPSQFRGPASLLSGPAGGVVAYASVAQAAGVQSAIGFDMGGTSTDVSRFAGEYGRIYESTTAGVRVLSAMMDIHTVAAGGGSICHYDGHAFQVGPESAGSEPGPLCYGNPSACELSITDINLALGRLQADRFPFELHHQRVRDALQSLQRRLSANGIERAVDEIAAGFLRVANDNMAQAIRQVSLARGFDVRQDALVVFGGAGGQHACAIARELGIRTILFHPLAGVLSAYGMGLANLGHNGERDAGRKPLTAETLAELEDPFGQLEREGTAALTEQGATKGIETVRRLDLRYQGTETCLTIDLLPADTLQARFERAHQRHFGWIRQAHTIEVVSLRVEQLSAPSQQRHVAHAGSEPNGSSAPLTPLRHERIWCTGRWHAQVPVYRREQLQPGSQVTGPACILESTGSILIDPGFKLSAEAGGLLRVSDTGALCEEPVGTTTASINHYSAVDPVSLEIMGNAFMSIAEQMGTTLQHTAISTNIRERLDFSCAVFDANAGLLANAPHIPVHLGAMSESVKDVAACHPDARPGDVFVTNDPAHGGSHLPDVTVVSPVFDSDGRLIFYAASRGHHADIGGITPGSMPPFSSTLEEEGVVLRSLRIVRGDGTADARGMFEPKPLRDALTQARYPARDPEQNIADIQAQVAANQLGATLLRALCESRGQDFVLAYAQHVQDQAADKVAELLANLKAELGDGPHHFVDSLDDGTPVGVQLTFTPDKLLVAFDSSPEHSGNANAPRAVSIAAVLYVLRCLVGSDLPLNSGALRHVEVRVAPNSLLNPSPTRAVVSGNVETSQRVVDVLLGALNRAAASQGTMNNITFGDGSFGYYETIAGGAGAGPTFDGASGVHTHMTNTRITDPEILETRFPVRLLRFGLRHDSGGLGRHRGGDGVVRQLEFLRPLDVSLLTERRLTQPFGLEGGLSGAPGVNLLNGVPQPARCHFQVAAGDVLTIETPGGGGFGKPS